ncbi:MAG: lysine-sensitive aspartokinase 3 [Acidobacteriota bacterium]|nr:lysine-sensitive aspartokinase 3 [Acidobacteriota bacterium]
MIVMKFGGSSLTTSDALTRVSGLVAERVSRQPVVVVSAMGGTTDVLVSAVGYSIAGNRQAARRQVAAIRDDVLHAAAPVLSEIEPLERLIDRHCDEIESSLEALAVVGSTGDGALTDAILSHGERISSRVITQLLTQQGVDAVHVDARDVLVTDDRFTEASPQYEPTNAQLAKLVRPRVEAGQVVVMGGFIGRTADGRVSTLGRGGSDFTASIVGAGIGANEIQIWTDVDGVMTADPTVVSDARPLRELSFAEASELAYFGGRVLHPSTVLPAIECDVPVRVLNSRKPEVEGTLIMASCPPTEMTVKSIASKRGITVIDIRSTRMLMAHGFLAAIFEVFDRFETEVDVVSTSEVGVSLTIDRTDRLEKVVSALRSFAEVSYAGGQAIVCLVGESLDRTPGVAARIFSALRTINVRMVSQGSARTNVSLVIDERDVDQAVNALHTTFFSMNELDDVG